MPLSSTLWLFECFKPIVVESGKKWDFVECSVPEPIRNIEWWAYLQRELPQKILDTSILPL